MKKEALIFIFFAVVLSGCKITPPDFSCKTVSSVKKGCRFDSECSENEFCLNRECVKKSCDYFEDYFEVNNLCCTTGKKGKIYCITDSFPLVSDNPVDVTLFDKNIIYLDSSQSIHYFTLDGVSVKDSFLDVNACFSGIKFDSSDTFWGFDKGRGKILKIKGKLIKQTLNTGQISIVNFTKYQDSFFVIDDEGYLYKIGENGNIKFQTFLYSPSPTDVSYNGKDLWYVDNESKKLFKIDYHGKILDQIITPGPNPVSVAINENGNIFVLDSFDLRIYRLEKVYSENQILCFIDKDHDEYGSKDKSVPIKNTGNCPPGYVNNFLDCNDNDPMINPGISEKCDGIDNNCNGKTDENIVLPCESVCGKGEILCKNGKLLPCNAPEPQEEVCDFKDNDCDGLTDEDAACCAPGEIKTVSLCKNQPYYFAFVIDNSGSMYTSDPKGIRYKGLLEFVDLMDGDFGIMIPFAEFPEVIGDFTNNKDELKKNIENAQNMILGTNTNIYDAMETAIKKLAGVPKSKVIILLTDGQDFYDAKKIKGTALFYNITIFALGLGKDVNEYILKQTVTSPENYFFIKKPEDIPEIYKKIFFKSKYESYLLCTENGWVLKHGVCF